MTKKALSYEVIVLLVLTCALLVFALILGMVTYQSSDAAAEKSCFSAVAARALGVQIQAGVETPLSACKTRVREFSSESNSRMQATLAQDIVWCQTSFRPAEDTRIAPGTTRFCHVCALYYDEQERVVQGAWERAQSLTNIPQTTQTLTEQEREQLEVEEDIPDDVSVDFALSSRASQKPMALLYVQDREETTPWWRRILGNDPALRGALIAGGGGAAGLGGVALAFGPPGWIAGALVVGGSIVVGGSAGAVAGGTAGFAAGTVHGFSAEGYSGILITELTDETLNELGCTRID